MECYISSRSTIIENAESRRFGMGMGSPGVYILLYDDDIVYVGQAANIHDRLKSHAKTAKQWNRHFDILVDGKPTRNNLEAFYIAQHDPLYNINKCHEFLTDEWRAMIDRTTVPGERMIIVGQYGVMIGYERKATEFFPEYFRELDGRMRC